MRLGWPMPRQRESGQKLRQFQFPFHLLPPLPTRLPLPLLLKIPAKEERVSVAQTHTYVKKFGLCFAGIKCSNLMKGDLQWEEKLKRPHEAWKSIERTLVVYYITLNVIGTITVVETFALPSIEHEREFS